MTGPLARSAVLSNYVDTALALGLDHKQLLEAHGITLPMLSNPEIKIPVRAISQLLEASAQHINTENFALQMALKYRLSILGHLGLAACEAPTVREFLSFVFQHMHTHNEAVTYTKENGPQTVSIIQYFFLPGGGQDSRQIREAALSGVVRILRIFLGNTWMPVQTYLSHGRPKDLKLHRIFFGNAITFNANFDAITFTESVLDTPIAGSNAVVAGYAKQLWVKTQRLKLGTVRSSMQQLIVVLLPAGRCTLQEVAHELMLEPRALQRRLQEERTSFTAVVDEIREELLNQFIRRSQRQLSDIAALLGFSQLSAFSRWHKVRFGYTAQQRRTQTIAAQKQ